MQAEKVSATSLTKFKDPLRVPPVLQPENGELRIRMRPERVRLHSELPPSELWTYEGHLPGPTIEVSRGQKIKVEWINQLPGGGEYPVVAVTAPDPPQDHPENAPQNFPGKGDGKVDETVAALSPWTVVHLHGGRTAATGDGWTENASLVGQCVTYHYENDQRATLLWYHDHAMGITRLNVFSGLAGLYMIRDEEEEGLGLPQGKYEVPLLIQDRNLDTAEDGSLTERLLHKVEQQTAEFFGPYTMINGTLWPYHEVEARQYRLRLLNGSNARTYRLVLLDEEGKAVPEMIKQIGTDGGLLGEPTALPEGGLVLASAERADLIVDFRGCGGRKFTLVNTAGAPFHGNPLNDALKPGDPDPENKLPHPEVMQFRVSQGRVNDPFRLPSKLALSYRRLDHDQLPPKHNHRVVALAEKDGMLTLRELEEVKAGEEVREEPLITVKDDKGMTTSYRTVATQFEDRVNWFVAYGSTEVWKILNLTEDTHPFHVHLVQFQALRRDAYTIIDEKVDPEATTATVTFDHPKGLDNNETGWKDTVRVNPGELVSIAATFDGFTGRYMYHCHILEHEDHDMMRPFLIIPAEVMANMGMDGMSGMPMPMAGPGDMGHSHR